LVVALGSSAHLKCSPRQPTRKREWYFPPRRMALRHFFEYFHYFALLNAPLVDTDVLSKPWPWSGCRHLLVCGIGEHHHYSLFPPINSGQWYIAKFSRYYSGSDERECPPSDPRYSCRGVTAASCLSGSCKWRIFFRVAPVLDITRSLARPVVPGSR
jgi:hypothetical protein